jgi:prepilin-type N-terminal cleavage/methylation domain-containing protein
MRRVFKSDKGMSLVEILVALFITGILTAAMFRVYINQHQAWMLQDSIIDVQQNARAAIDELGRQLRMSGYALPNGTMPFAAYNSNPDSITVYYKTSDCQVAIKHAMTSAGGDLLCDSQNVTCFPTGTFAYIYNTTLEMGEYFTVTSIDSASWTIAHAGQSFSRLYPKNSPVMIIQKLTYFIDRSDTLHPCLMARIGNGTAQVYSENITDMQLTYTLKNGVTVAVPTTIKDVRTINISLTARTATKDPKFNNGNYLTESYKSNVFLRNIGV